MQGYLFRPATEAEQDDTRFTRCRDADFVLEVNEDVVCHALAHQMDGLFTIKMMQTRPDVERRGYGRYFIHELEDMARRQDASRVEAWDVGEDSKKFWRKAGFHYDRTGDDVEVWCKNMTSLRFWIPIVGYYLNLKALPPEERNIRMAAIHTLVLAAFPVLGCFIPFSPVIPMGVMLYCVSMIDLVLVAVIVASTILETMIVTRSTNPDNRKFGRFGWSRLVGARVGYVRSTFLFFNYHEVMFAMVGITFVFVLHAIV